MAVNFNPGIVLDGLVVCLDAANIKSYNSSVSTTAWNDLSGLNNNATLDNGASIPPLPTYTNSFGGYINFDGTDDYAYISNSYKSFANYSTDRISIEAWINLPSVSSIGDKPIVYRDGNTTNDYGLRTNSSGQIQAYFGNGTTTSISTYTTSLVSNTWYQLIAVWSGTSALYVNGVSVATNSQTLSGATDNDSYAMKIANFTNTYLNIRVASVKIYNKALLISEITQNFNALRGRFSI